MPKFTLCLGYLSFILLNLSNNCFAYSFEDLKEKIQKKSIYNIDYNFSKTAAIVNPNSHSAVYVNFKARQIKTIVTDWQNVFAIWKSDDIVHLEGSCGTGCSQSIIFLAPSTSIVCPVHEFRFESLNQDEPPDFYNNDPLLIEPYKKIYICYAEENVIQIFKMPEKLQATIYPPKGYFAESATIHHGRLSINYSDINERKKKIFYQKINL